jgi:methanogenic corrinoid protein MtbC1
MSSKSNNAQQVLVERFFETLIAGDRVAARQIVDECLVADVAAERIIEHLFYPVLAMIQTLYRNDQLSKLSHHYATRLLRMLVDQMQLRLNAGEARDRDTRVLLLCGPSEPDELEGQMAADLLEAAGFQVFFAGGGIANDEVVEQIGSLQPHKLVLFGSTPADLPHIRQLIDELHDIGKCPQMQIVVGGGVFNRAEELAEEIGADVWATTPCELVEAVAGQGQRRMSPDQRTVGRRRRERRTVAA